jgi:hypothetical protein
MDPWLESPSVFSDLHNRFITYFSEALNAVLPAPYFAAIANRVWIEQSERRVEPDVNVLHPPGNGAPAGTKSAGGVAVADAVGVQPVKVRVPRDELTEWFVEVHAAPGGERLVTMVEVLSPTNKRAGTEGRELYLKKQREARQSKVHLIEIDLLRSGLHTSAVPLDWARGEAGPFDYHVCVRRFDQFGEYTVYPIRMPQRLPKIDVPLLPGTPDVSVDLQPLLDRCYDTGQYLRRVRYADPTPEPALSAELADWADGILTARGLLRTSAPGNE